MHHKPLDKAGISVAILCALHCLFLPVLLPVFSLLGLTFMGMLAFERGILLVSMIIGAFAVSKGFKHHQSLMPAVMLVSGGLLYFYKHTGSHLLEIVMIFMGAALIIGAHGLNLYLCRARNSVPCESVEAQQEALESESVSASHASQSTSA